MRRSNGKSCPLRPSQASGGRGIAHRGHGHGHDAHGERWNRLLLRDVSRAAEEIGECEIFHVGTSAENRTHEYSTDGERAGEKSRLVNCG